MIRPVRREAEGHEASLLLPVADVAFKKDVNQRMVREAAGALPELPGLPHPPASKRCAAWGFADGSIRSAT